ncbi:hypothetical protein LXN10_07575 [Arcobacter sp. KX21116]|uniref:hypothetical protein n=1 Tax=Arcobacter iocasae TaxID=2906515 RepID=UPI0035D45769
MKKGLHVSNGFNVNLENVCVWIVEKESIQLQMNSAEGMNNLINIILETSDETGSFSHKVSINEFKRIEREITEYMSGK